MTDPIAALKDRTKALEVNAGKVNFKFTGGGRGFTRNQNVTADGKPYDIRNIEIAVVLTSPADKRNTPSALKKLGSVPIVFPIFNEVSDVLLEVWSLYAASTSSPDVDLGERVLALVDGIEKETKFDERAETDIEVDAPTDEQYEDLGEVVEGIIERLAEAEGTGSLKANMKWNKVTKKRDTQDTFNPWVVDTRRLEVHPRD